MPCKVRKAVFQSAFCEEGGDAMSVLELGHDIERLYCIMKKARTLDLNAWAGPGPDNHRLCNLGQVTKPLCALLSSSVK